MIAIACASQTNQPFDKAMIKEFYESSLRRHRKLGLTGYLSWTKGHFFQYLEGPENAVDEALQAINNDQHQTLVKTLQLGSIKQRRFSRWDMLNISGSGVPDIRIQNLIEDVMKSSNGNVFDDSESRRIILDMLDQMSKLHQENRGRRFGAIGPQDTDSHEHPPYVVVLGASAGGMSPLQSIVRSLDQGLDAAFVVIQHFSPETETMMDMILQRDTSMKVQAAESDMPISAGNIYVIPPGQNLEIVNGIFTLNEQKRAGRGPQFPIDICFRSIAREYGDKAIAVILSGTGTDGSRGAKVVNEAGGVVLAQSTASSEFNGMPQASIDAGVVHQVLAPIDIADFLNNLSTAFLQESLALKPALRIEYVNKVVAILEDNDVDFSQYKSETLFRRIERRRVIANISTSEEYLEFLQHDEVERAELREDILITVTSFFRDADAWSKLSDAVSQQIERDLKPGETYRVWVTACATGEEVYTLGIILTELLENLNQDINFKIYATDIERKALAIASSGCYSERALEQIGKQRRDRFFTKKADGYVIDRGIRENVIFAPHNFIKNAPFTRMHLVTCRNVLIYMQPELQQVAIKMLHFALHVNGILFLGPSETLGNLQSEFYPVQREWNQYKKLRNLRLPLHLSAERLRDTSRELATAAQPMQLKDGVEVNGLLGLSLDAISRYTGNTNILVDSSRSVMTVISDPTGLLQVHRGEPTLDVVKMIPEGLRPSLTFALARAFKDLTDVTHRQIACSPIGKDQRDIDIEVFPHTPDNSAATQYALVVLSHSKSRPASTDEQPAADENQVEELRFELNETKKALQSAINDLETLDDEQRSINEQLSAANEELQSTNEELQSVNEELYTVNFEYQTKIHELSDLNQDLDNLLDSTNLGVIFLDSDLCIRRFTEVATKTLNLLPADIGRPFVDLAHKLNYKGLTDDMRRVLSIGKSINREITRADADSLNVGIHPYRANSGLAQGVLVMFREYSTMSTDDMDPSSLDMA